MTGDRRRQRQQRVRHDPGNVNNQQSSQDAHLHQNDKPNFGNQRSHGSNRQKGVAYAEPTREYEPVTIMESKADKEENANSGSKYKKRQVLSNWSRYEEVILEEENIEDGEDYMIGEDFSRVLQLNEGKQGGYLHLKGEMSWGEGDEEILSSHGLGALKLADLVAAMNTIPLHIQLGIPEDELYVETVNQFNLDAEASKQNYKPDQNFVSDIDVNAKFLETLKISEDMALGPDEPDNKNIKHSVDATSTLVDAFQPEEDDVDLETLSSQPSTMIHENQIIKTESTIPYIKDESPVPISKEKSPSPFVQPPKEKSPSPFVQPPKEKSPSPFVQPPKEKSPSPFVQPPKEKSPSPFVQPPKEKSPSPFVQPPKERCPSPFIQPQKEESPSPLVQQKEKSPSPLIQTRKEKSASPSPLIIQSNRKEQSPSPLEIQRNLQNNKISNSNINNLIEVPPLIKSEVKENQQSINFGLPKLSIDTQSSSVAAEFDVPKLNIGAPKGQRIPKRGNKRKEDNSNVDPFKPPPEVPAEPDIDAPIVKEEKPVLLVNQTETKNLEDWLDSVLDD